MRWRRLMPGVIAVLVPLAGLGLLRAGGVPEPAPCRFSGSARVRMAPAPAGTVVEAWVDEEKVAETTVRVEGAEARYALALPGRYRGRTVVFRFPDYPNLSRAGLGGCAPGREAAVDLDADAHQGCGGA